MNHLAATTENKEAIGQVFNTAVGDKTTLLELTNLLKKYLSEFVLKIEKVEIVHGPNRAGDIPYSSASVEKARYKLNYVPNYSLELRLKEAIGWYWTRLI
jgi:UDP-N-acetylglucosamine 4-epimerase